MKLLIQIITVVWIFTGCVNNQNDDSIVLAEVDGTSITLNEALNNISKYELAADSLKALNDFRKKWIENQLIQQEISRLNLESNEEIRKKLQRAKEQTLLLAFQEAVLSSANQNVTVTDEEVRFYYQENRDRFLLNERYLQFRHMIASSLTEAQNAKRDLMRGYEWERVANEYSINPQLSISNASRYWPESTALKEFQVLNRYLQLIGVSEISLIENINGNYHFVQLTDQKPAGEHPDLDWLLSQIREWLILEKKRSAYNRYVKNLYLAAQANNEIQLFDVLPEQIDSSSSESKPDSLNSN